MTSTPTLPPLPTRTISTNLTDLDLDLDRLDHIRRMSPDLPPRAALVREAVLLWLDLHEDPATAVGLLVDGLAAIYAADADVEAGRIGEPKGSA